MIVWVRGFDQPLPAIPNPALKGSNEVVWPNPEPLEIAL